MISLNLAKREIKNNLKYWSFFAFNLTLGLLGFTFILIFKGTVSESLELRSKTLLSSELAITGRRALEGKEREKVSELLNSNVKTHSKLTELYSMGRVTQPDNRSRLIFIKALNGEYPLIGKIQLKQNGILNSSLINKLQEKPFTIISKEVAHQFKLTIGGEISIGKQAFEVLDILEFDSTSSMRGVSLAPKVYIGHNHLKSTELISFGTVAWYTDFYLFNDNVDLEQTKIEVESIITDPAIKVRTPKNSSEQLSRILNYLTDYLGLIGVVALLISSVGSAYLFQSYILDRLKQIGILKSLGLSHLHISMVFINIILFFGAISSLIAFFLAKALLPLGIEYLNKWMVGEFNIALSMDTFLIIFCIGVVINLFVCLPVLSKILKSKTINLLNNSFDESESKKDYLLFVPALLVLWGLSVWQAHSFIIGSVFTASLLVVFICVLLVLPYLLNSISKLMIGKKVSSPLNLYFGMALRLLTRNQLSTVMTVLSLAIGITLITVIGQIDSSLKSELTESKEPKPSLFMFDIQDEQMEELVTFAKEKDIPLQLPSPMIRARLLKKNGEKVKRVKKDEGFQTREQERSNRFNNRGVNLSYAKEIKASEKIIEGKPFSGKYKGEGPAEVSLEKRYAKRLGVGIGDTLTYDILGVELEAKIVNLRQVKWTSFNPNFFIVFQPGVLEDAPKSFLAIVDQVSFEKQLEIQDLIVERFGNISILNVTEVITKILTLFKAMAWAIGIMSLCCILVGQFVLYSILQSQMHKKAKDLALQKIVGLNSGGIFKTLLFEYSTLAIFAVAIGNIIGCSVAYLVSFLFLDGVFVFNTIFMVSFNLITILMAIMIIYISFKNNYSKSVNTLFQEG